MVATPDGSRVSPGLVLFRRAPADGRGRGGRRRAGGYLQLHPVLSAEAVRRTPAGAGGGGLAAAQRPAPLLAARLLHQSSAPDTGYQPPDTGDQHRHRARR